MEPIFFKEANAELLKPPIMSDKECAPLPIYRENETCISCWKASFWQRVKFLFHGKIWLGVLSGETQPPVWVDCTKTVFIKK